jgi:hypothetical protein
MIMNEVETDKVFTSKEKGTNQVQSVDVKTLSVSTSFIIIRLENPFINEKLKVIISKHVFILL